MIPTIIIFILSFYWLLRETDYLRLNLAYTLMPDYSGEAGYRVYTRIGTKKRRNSDGHFREHNYNGHTNYDIVLQPGIDNVLCGWDWLDQHCGKLVNYHPQFHLETLGVRYDMTIKQPAIIKDIVKANRISKRELKARLAAI